MKTIRNISYWGAVSLLVLAIFAFVVPKFFGIQFRAVTTGSMEPERPVGCLVVIVPTPFEDIGVGNDIAFVSDESLTVVTHRVAEVSVQDQSFVTRGIANETSDPKAVQYENVIGKVAFSVNGLGYVIHWLNPLPNKIIAICVIVALVTVSLLVTDGAGKQKPKREDTQKR